MRQPRIRMFAGPNCSGKSTVKEYLLPRHIGAYLNANEVEKVLNQTQILDLDSYHPQLDSLKLIEFLKYKKKKINQENHALLMMDRKRLSWLELNGQRY